MIEFIIYEENKEYLEMTKSVIDKVMMNYDYDYNVVNYNSLQEFDSTIPRSSKFKVYILEIREKQEDWQSMIILTSKTEDYKLNILEQRLMILDYLLKNSSYEKQLEKDLELSLKNYDTRPNTLKYNYKNVWYNIPLSKIIYIEKEPDSKRCIINTETATYYAAGNLCKLSEKLDKRFLKCNRSYIINLEQVEEYNTKENIITFGNKSTLNIISRTKRKEIIDYLRKIA